MCSLVLTGALTVGDSVRSTLRNLAEQRIGKGDIAMLSPDGFFEEELATRIYDSLEDEQAVIAPIALSQGILPLLRMVLYRWPMYRFSEWTKDFGSLLEEFAHTLWAHGR